MRAWMALVAVSPAFIAPAVGACGRGDAAHVSVAPSIVFPRGLLDAVTSITLNVYDATTGANAIACDPVTGRATNVTNTSPTVTTATLNVSTGCTGGAKFCGTVSVTEAATARIFWAQAVDASNREYADGCVSYVIDKDQRAITIKMQRFIPATVCGNKIVEATEQCDPPGSDSDMVCDTQCHSKEEYFSSGSATGNGTIAGGVGDKVQPSFLWPAGSGAAGRFVGVWGDKSATPRTHVAMRLLGDSLATFPDLGTEILGSAIFLPNDPSKPMVPQPPPGNQFYPSITLSGSKYYVVFQDDAQISASSQGLDVHMRTIDAATLVTDQPVDPSGGSAALGINGLNGSGEANAQTRPVVAAGPNGDILIVWQDSLGDGQPGSIVVRKYFTQTKQLDLTQNTVSSGNNNSHPVVAGTSTHWVVAWESDNNILIRSIDGNGIPNLPAQNVPNALHHGLQDHPSIAVIDGDRYAVAWADHGAAGGTDIFLQRYAGDDVAHPNDQDTAVNNVIIDGEQISPAIGATGIAGGAFIVAWIDQTSNHVRARVAGGTSGYLFNNVDGSANEFQVSLLDGHPRANPAVAGGGGGPYIVVGWEDLDQAKPGIFGRRFPAPAR